MDEATIVGCRKQPGGAFQRGNAIDEIETEKINNRLEVTDVGVMVEHAVGEGENVVVGGYVCVVGLGESGDG